MFFNIRGCLYWYICVPLCTFYIKSILTPSDLWTEHISAGFGDIRVGWAPTQVPYVDGFIKSLPTDFVRSYWCDHYRKSTERHFLTYNCGRDLCGSRTYFFLAVKTILQILSRYT